MLNTAIELGDGFGFCAAHIGLHDGRFERLHGHSFAVRLRVEGPLDAAGMLTDFGPLKDTLRQVVAPLHRRTLVAAEADGTIRHDPDGRVLLTDGHKRYDLPADDVVLLPVPNTTTEALAGHLLDQLAGALTGSRIRHLALTVAESPGVSATVHRDYP